MRIDISASLIAARKWLASARPRPPTPVLSVWLAFLGVVLVGCSDAGTKGFGTESLTLASADGGDAGPGLDIFQRVAPPSGPPEAFVIAPDVVLTEQDFLDRYAHELWELTDEDEIRSGGVPLVNGEYVTHVYVQYYAGFPVAGGSLALTSRNDHLVSGIGDFVAHVDRDLGDIELVDGRVKKLGVHHGRAKQLAFNEVEQSLGLTKRVPVYDEPKGEIVLSRGRVAWRFEFSTKEPFAHRRIDIDANDGSVLMHKDLLFGVWEPRDVPAFGVDHDGDPTTQDDLLTILAEVESGQVATGDPKTRLRHGPLNMAVYDDATVPMNQLFSTLVDFTSPHVGFSDPYTDFPVTTMWAMESSAYYLQGLFGLEGLDGGGGGVDAHMNLSIPTPGNAPAYSALYNAIMIPTGSSQQRYDALAHEVAHSVQTQLESSVGIQPSETTEKAALWESYADIFGMAIEQQITGVSLDWTIGQPVIRRLDDPTQSPSEPQSVFYGDSVFNAGDKYVQAGVQSKWFHLLATGGTPPVPGVTAVGVETAQRIALGAMIFGQPTTYLQAVEASLQQASQECGSYSELWASIHNAWYHVGAGTLGFYSEPLVSPPEGGTDVQPWPATISFSSFEEEQVWEVEIDTVDTFDGDDHRGPFTLTTPDSAGLLSIELNLRPSTTYFWRVRANLPEDTTLGCWREAHSFTTGSMTPELIAPTTGSDLHPWDVEFEWKESAAGSVNTRLTISADGRPDYVQQLAPCGTQAECTETENLPVDGSFTWSVQLEGPTDLYSPNVSESARSDTLHTNIPESAFLSRSGGPWPSTMEWREVDGASAYAASVRTRFGDAIWDTTDATGNSAEVYLDPNYEDYEFTIEPLGPDVVLGFSGMQEHGKQTTDRFAVPFETRYLASVEVLDPSPFRVECRRQDTDTTVTWTQAEGAEYYVVSVFEREVPWPSGNYDLCGHSTKIDEFTVPHEPGVSTQSVEVPSYRGSFSTFLAAGYVVNVTAYSPGGRFDSWCGGSDSEGVACEPDDRCTMDGWYVQPEPPVPSEPLDGAVLEGDESTLRWTYSLANGGSFYLETYNGHSCSGGYTVATTIETGATTGFGYQEIEWGKPGWPASGENLKKSWRVRPTGVYRPCDISPQWSPCQGITVRSSCGGRAEACCGEGEPCEGNLLCDNGTCDVCGTEGNLCCGPEQGVECAIGLECQAGRCGRPEDIFPCGEPVVHSGNWVVPEPQDIDLGATKGQFWFGFDTVNIPDKIEVYRSGQLIASTAEATGTDGCVGAAGGMLVDLDEGSPIVTVYVEPNCEYEGLTQWAYLVGCAAESSIPAASLEQ